MNIKLKIRAELFQMQDIKYRDFHSALMPTIEKENIIGVPVPILRRYAKNMEKHSDISSFLSDLPHQYYEENNLHAFIIQNIKDFDECMIMLEKFLPYLDNWATCDMLRPKCFKKHKTQLYEYIKVWLKSDKPYIVRYALGMLNSYYLDEHFDKAHLELAASVDSNEYYVKMMVAWYFATALSKQYSCALQYIENKRLSPWVHNKTIQKAVESYRISLQQKEYLKTLKI